MTREYAFNMLRRVHDELNSGHFAIAHVLATWHTPRVHSAVVQTGHTHAQLLRCYANLEMTFILRLFTQFEATLRDYWLVGMGRTTEPGMFDLMEGIAASRSINRADLALAHGVRDFRNHLTHEIERTPRLDFSTCACRLGRYLRWLPLDW
jgi:hypothetical protein